MRCTIRGVDVALEIYHPRLRLFDLHEHMEKLESPLSGPVEEVHLFVPCS